jgi:hypothetical protein
MVGIVANDGGILICAYSAHTKQDMLDSEIINQHDTQNDIDPTRTFMMQTLRAACYRACMNVLTIDDCLHSIWIKCEYARRDDDPTPNFRLNEATIVTVLDALDGHAREDNMTLLRRMLEHVLYIQNAARKQLEQTRTRYTQAIS